MKYRTLNHTGDAGVEVFGETKEALFANAGFALFDIITQAEKIKSRQEKHIQLNARDLEALLVQWLNELIYLYDTERFLGGDFLIHLLGESSIDSSVHGEIFDPLKHRINTEVKAATYHHVRIRQENGLWKTDIIFDL